MSDIYPPTGETPQAPAPPPPPRPMKPHRGTTVLVLGILGLVFCFICGIIALVMGNNDLQEMDRGIMDPSGRPLTSAGRICGIISLIVGIFQLIGIIAAVVIPILAGSAHG